MSYSVLLLLRFCGHVHYLLIGRPLHSQFTACAALYLTGGTKTVQFHGQAGVYLLQLLDLPLHLADAIIQIVDLRKAPHQAQTGRSHQNDSDQNQSLVLFGQRLFARAILRPVPLLPGWYLRLI
jgi:hypothetical protein